MVKLNINQDVLLIPTLNDLVIATDNSGAIGEKEWDEVSVSYETVGYFLFRVSYMECLAAGALPHSIILNNFNGDLAWGKLVKGIEKGFAELESPILTISGSTESNFELKQSATSISLVGRQVQKDYRDWENHLTKDYDLAVIGKPLVGNEVLTFMDDLASLKSFKWLSNQEEVLALIPVGSKGVESELKKIDPNLEVQFPEKLDINKSAGPASCFIVVFKKEFNQKLQQEIREPIFKGLW